jgi:phage shock protein PspC (stress-responsive transcriptional regulator)
MRTGTTDREPGEGPDADPRTGPDTGAPPTGRPRPGSSRFFDWIRSSGLERGEDRWAAGVCAGIARRTGLDPLLVRGLALVVAVLGGPALILYAVAWALLPDVDGSIHAERLLEGRMDPAVIAIAALAVLGLIPVGHGLWFRGVPGWLGMPDWLETVLGTGWADADAAPTGAAHAGAAPRAATFSTGAAPREDPSWQWRRDADRRDTSSARGASGTGPGAGTPTDRDRAEAHRERERERRERERAREARRREAWRARQPSVGFVTTGLGLALLIGAVTGLSAGLTGWSTHPLVIGLAACVAVLGVATVFAGIRGRESGGLGFFSFLATLALVVLGIVPAGTHIAPFGETVWDVGAGQVSSTSAPANYAMIVGSPTLDLSDLATVGGVGNGAEAGTGNGNGTGSGGNNADGDVPETETSTDGTVAGAGSGGSGSDETTGAANTGGEIDLWLGAGSARVILPDDVPIQVEVSGMVTGVDSSDTDLVRPGNTLLTSSTGQTSAARDASPEDITTVRIHILFGNADVQLEDHS